MEYFTHERISKRIIRIVDISDTASYLVEGNERACLIDTGSGIGSLRAYVDSLTNLAYDVVLTHGHVDHASGAWEFKDKKVYLHPEDRELMKVHTVFGNRTGYVENVKKITIPEEDFIPQLDPAKTLEIAHGDIFDLGDVHVEIVHTPGHTRGMCMFVCHPGYLDAYIMKVSSLLKSRPLEVEMACSQETKDWLKENDIEIVTYDDLD